MSVQEEFKDFRKFLVYVWRHLNLPDPTDKQMKLAWYLQYGPRRKVIMAFRGVGKSWITSAYVCWRLLLNPQRKFLVVSASKVRADDFSTFTKRLINELPVLHHLRAKGSQRDSNVAFDVGPALPDHAPSVKSLGITGQLAGSRADEIIADDIEVPNNSLTQSMRDKLAEAVKEFDAILKPNGVITYLGTPQTEMSVYNLMPERGYEIRIWPARYPDHKMIAKYEGKLAPDVLDDVSRDPSIIGKPTDPLRFDDTDLLEREASYGRSGFALQFMLDTSLSDAERYPLKLNDLVIMNVDSKIAPARLAWASGPDQLIEHLPNVGFTGDRYVRPLFIDKEFVEYSGSVMFIDPSGRGQDETGYAVVKMLHGNLFVRRCGGLLGGYADETLVALSKIARDEKVNMVLVESNFGDGMFTQLLKPIMRKYHDVSIEESRATGQKELRIIDTLEPVMNQHRLILDEQIILDDIKTEKPKYQLLYQLTRLTKERGSLAHDDRLDALEGAVRYWIEQLAADDVLAAMDHKEALKEQALEEFVDRATRRTRRSGWMSEYDNHRM